MKEIVRYWQLEYDWRKQEQILNEKLPSFKIDVDGLDIHFSHVKVSLNTILNLTVNVV